MSYIYIYIWASAKLTHTDFIRFWPKAALVRFQGQHAYWIRRACYWPKAVPAQIQFVRIKSMHQTSPPPEKKSQPWISSRLVRAQPWPQIGEARIYWQTSAAVCMQKIGRKQIFNYVVARQAACLVLEPPAGDPTIAEERAKSIKKYWVFLLVI